MRLLTPIIRATSMILAAFWCGLFSTAIFSSAEGREVNLLGATVPTFQRDGDEAQLSNLFAMFFSPHSILIVLTILLLLLPCLLLNRYDQSSVHNASMHKWLEVAVFLTIGVGVLVSYLVADRTDVGWLLVDVFLAIAAAGILYKLGAEKWFARKVQEAVPHEKRY